MNSVIVFVLVAIAAGLLVAALVSEALPLAIAAMVVSFVSPSIVLVRVWLDSRSSRAVDDDTPAVATSEVEQEEPAEQEIVAEDDAQDEQPSTTPALVRTREAGAVRVVPGRKRFHEPDCTTLRGRASEEITREEAEEEGFTPCSICAKGKSSIRRVV